MSPRTILWLYRQLLRCLPSEFRSQYGSEMETAFSVTLERSHRRPYVIGRAALDVLATAAELRWAARRSDQPKRPRAFRWEGFFLDIPLALRRLRKSPGLSRLAVNLVLASFTDGDVTLRLYGAINRSQINARHSRCASKRA